MSKRAVDRIRKVTAQAARAGTEGERRAAEVGLTGLRKATAETAAAHLTDAVVKRLPYPRRAIASPTTAT